MLEARRVKDERRRKHSRLGESKQKPGRKKVVIAEQTVIHSISESKSLFFHPCS